MNESSPPRRHGSIVERVGKRISKDLLNEDSRDGSRSRTSSRYADGETSTLVVNDQIKPRTYFSKHDALSEQAQTPSTVAETSNFNEAPSALGAKTTKSDKPPKPKLDVNLSRLAAMGFVTPNSTRNRTTDEMRLIKRSLLNCRMNSADSNSNLILVTSSVNAEGKTFTAVNLALSLAAEENIEVLLVDADFYKRDAFTLMGLESELGLIDVLKDPDMDFEEVLFETNIPNFSVIPSGQYHERSTELLGGSRVKEFFDNLACGRENRLTIIDCPPLLLTTEAVALTSHVGQVLFVIRAESTREEQVRRAIELIDARPTVGMVLNRANMRSSTSSYGTNYYTAYEKRSS